MKRLQRLMEIQIITGGKTKLCDAINRGERQIERYISGDSLPSRKNAYKLALACGCKESEALAIAREIASDRPRKSA